MSVSAISMSGELRHLEDVADQLLGEADAAGADDGDL